MIVWKDLLIDLLINMLRKVSLGNGAVFSKFSLLLYVFYIFYREVVLLFVSE